jgi:sugar phosphate isomerase/epimerase
MKLNRREFADRAGIGAASALISLSLAKAESPLAKIPPMRSTFNGVAVGANTYSLPQLTLKDALRAFAEIGFGIAELHPRHVEPAFGPLGRGARMGLPTEQQTSPATAARQKLREWRLMVPLEQFEAIGTMFKAQNIFLYAYNMNYRDDFTDDELERSFQMTRALGCNVITAVGSKQLFKRLDPLATKYKTWVAIHNEGDSIPTMADFEEVLKSAGAYTQMTLDIGHFVASNSDPVACLEKHHKEIVNLHIKDRKKNGGANLPFGQGDTPIKDILGMDRDRKYNIPVHVEWEVAGADRVQKVKDCFEYCKNTLLRA